MAVTVLHRTRARSRQFAAWMPPGALLVTLLAPAVDLFASVQPAPYLTTLSLLGAALAALVLLATWTRFPRTDWLAAACIAAVASLALRVAGAEVAPFLSLLVVLGLGVGGAFASHEQGLEIFDDRSPQRRAPITPA